MPGVVSCLEAPKRTSGAAEGGCRDGPTIRRSGFRRKARGVSPSSLLGPRSIRRSHPGLVLGAGVADQALNFHGDRDGADLADGVSGDGGRILVSRYT
jgi:hypothetical protein